MTQIENTRVGQGRKKRDQQLAGGLALHEMHRDLGMGEGRVWIRAHRAGGRRRAWKESCCKGEKSGYRVCELWRARKEVGNYNSMSSREEARLQ